MQTIYILKSDGNEEEYFRATDSLEDLRDIVAKITETYSGNLIFQEIILNCNVGLNNKWKWAHVSPHSYKYKFTQGILPPKEYWDTNLVLIDLSDKYYFQF
jgi:hypothetical protein